MMRLPFGEGRNCSTAAPKGRVAYAHLPVSALHTSPPQDATAARLFISPSLLSGSLNWQIGKFAYMSASTERPLVYFYILFRMIVSLL